MKQPLWAAHERTSWFVKTKRLIGRVSDANPHRTRNSNFCGRPLKRCWRRTYQYSKPKRPARKQVQSIEAPINSECRCQPPRPACEIEERLAPAVPPHQLDSFERLERPNQDASANASHFA